MLREGRSVNSFRAAIIEVQYIKPKNYGRSCPGRSAASLIERRPARQVFYGCLKYRTSFCVWNKPSLSRARMRPPFLLESHKRDGPHSLLQRESCKYKVPIYGKGVVGEEARTGCLLTTSDLSPSPTNTGLSANDLREICSSSGGACNPQKAFRSFSIAGTNGKGSLRNCFRDDAGTDLYTCRIWWVERTNRIGEREILIRFEGVFQKVQDARRQRRICSIRRLF